MVKPVNTCSKCLKGIYSYHKHVNMAASVHPSAGLCILLIIITTIITSALAPYSTFAIFSVTSTANSVGFMYPTGVTSTH